jgi:hypothetical protein
MILVAHTAVLFGMALTLTWNMGCFVLRACTEYSSWQFGVVDTFT